MHEPKRNNTQVSCNQLKRGSVGTKRPKVCQENIPNAKAKFQSYHLSVAGRSNFSSVSATSTGLQGKGHVIG